jgi:hypothetical protein
LQRFDHINTVANRALRAHVRLMQSFRRGPSESIESKKQFDASRTHMDARRLLLGGVAGLIAVVGAHAAEIPVKAKAVQYVRVCTLYGDGFYFIPGTQTCMKIGGFVRAEIKYDAIGSFEPAINGANAQFFRGGDQIDTRVRAGISLDAREQTAYGTLRAYLLGGWQYTSNDAPTLSLPGTAVPTAGGAATAGATPNGANNLLCPRLRPVRRLHRWQGSLCFRFFRHRAL